MNFSTTIVLITGDIKCACELFIDERNIWYTDNNTFSL